MSPPSIPKSTSVVQPNSPSPKPSSYKPTTVSVFNVKTSATAWTNYTVVRLQASSIPVPLLTLLQAFNMPPQIYCLGVERSKQLEDIARSHFQVHANWVCATTRQQAAEAALLHATKAAEETRAEVKRLEDEVSAAVSILDDAVTAAYKEVHSRGLVQAIQSY